MIARISGRILELEADRVLLEVGPLAYEVLVPPVVLAELTPGEDVTLQTLHYFQMEQNRATPVLIGFVTRDQREFWEAMAGVLGPKVAAKSFAAPASKIATWVETGDVTALKSLPGLGQAKAREAVAKLQGKLGRFASVDAPVPSGKGKGKGGAIAASPFTLAAGPSAEAIDALVGLDYNRTEATDLVNAALRAESGLDSAEAILDAVFRRR